MRLWRVVLLVLCLALPASFGCRCDEGSGDSGGQAAEQTDEKPPEGESK